MTVRKQSGSSASSLSPRLHFCQPLQDPQGPQISGQQSPAVRNGPLSLLKSQEEGKVGRRGLLTVRCGWESRVKVEKLSEHKEAPLDVGTPRDSDRGDRNTPSPPLGGEGHNGSSRDVPLTHCVVVNGSCWGEVGRGGGKEGCRDGEGWPARGSKFKNQLCGQTGTLVSCLITPLF